jgi:hypothetical protein
MDADALMFGCKSCSNSWAGRFYSPLTHMPAICRQFIKSVETGKSLVELDVKNCQIHMINKVLMDRYGEGSTGALNSDLRNQVDIYEKIASEMYSVAKPTDSQRKKVKKLVFEHLFNAFRGTFSSAGNLKKDSLGCIAKLYPELIESVSLLRGEQIPGYEETLTRRQKFAYVADAVMREKIDKTNGHRKVSFSTTKLEVKLMKMVWKDLCKQKIPFITIHDAILIDPVHVSDAMISLRRVMQKSLGYIPKIKKVQLAPKIPSDLLSEAA